MKGARKHIGMSIKCSVSVMIVNLSVMWLCIVTAFVPEFLEIKVNHLIKKYNKCEQVLCFYQLQPFKLEDGRIKKLFVSSRGLLEKLKIININNK
jgi:hypothetical protein